jgi:hypothetical protein
MTKSTSMYLNIGEKGEVISSQKSPATSVSVPFDFFYEYTSTYWLFNFETNELELIPNAEALRDAAVAAEADAKAAKLAAEVAQAAIDIAIREFQEETTAMTADYSQAEIDTFLTQEAEAMGWLADNAWPTPLLDAILSESGEVKATMVDAILMNAGALKIGVGKAIGRKNKKVKGAG